jgi:predicted dehydrogenase
MGFRHRHVFGSKGSLESAGDRNGRPLKVHLDDGTVIDDARMLELAPSYRLNPLAAELFGGERVWTYSMDFNDTDSRILALEYHELGDCVQKGTRPEVTGEEGRADVALVYAPYESGRLGRAVTLDEMITLKADNYLREIDEMIGLLKPVGV